MTQSPEGLFTDYAAHSELVLSPYFADPCGLQEGDDAEGGVGSSAVLGHATVFCYECVLRDGKARVCA